MVKFPDEKLSLAIVEDLKRQGLNQSQIAEMFGVTRQHVSWIKQTYSGTRTPREVALDNFPFEVSALQQQASPCRRLRDHGEYMATGGKGMSEDKLKRLRAFYRKLRKENAVVEFDPELPPIKGVSLQGGWAYRPRQPEDGDLIIRVNEHTNMTNEGKMIWRLPPHEP